MLELIHWEINLSAHAISHVLKKVEYDLSSKINCNLGYSLLLFGLFFLSVLQSQNSNLKKNI